MFYLEASDYIVEEPEDFEDDEPPSATPSEPSVATISLEAIAGIRTEDTMQVYITLGNEQFVALLDSGSTHNFIRGDGACRVGLQFSPCPGRGVIVANGDRVECTGLARDVGVRIADEFFSVDCYSIPLDKWDMILGVTFLRTLGPILWDFDDLCMAFTKEGRRVFWRGIGSTRHDVQSTRLPVASTPSAPRNQHYWTSCCSRSMMSSLLLRACHLHELVITVFICSPTRLQWQCGRIDTLSCRRMNWNRSVLPCYSKG